ncbi:MAG TPA: GAF domain-containing protein, partial [Ignavibacteriales bacterium]|nr:GAF domain-containing protein [Ignavibacteriales bacterium]
MQNKISNLSSIIDFSNTINKTLDYKFILDNLLLTCLARFKTSKGIVVLLEEQNNLKIVSYKGIRKSDIDKIRENIDNSVILDILIKNFNLFLQINLKYDEKIIGYILLGKKITNESYTKEEQEHLEILGNIAAIALTNAKHLQQVNDINNEL